MALGGGSAMLNGDVRQGQDSASAQYFRPAIRDGMFGYRLAYMRGPGSSGLAQIEYRSAIARLSAGRGA